MPDNQARYGFRMHSLINGQGEPNPVVCRIASAQDFDVTGLVQSASLRAGDLVTRIAGGFVRNTVGAEDTAEPPFGVVVGVKRVFDPNLGMVVPSKVVQSGIVFGTNLERQTLVMVIPIDQCFWEVDAHTGGPTTQAGWEALEGLNVDHIMTGPTVGTNPELEIRPKIDVANAADTNSLHFRVERVSDTQDNKFFDGANVKLIVRYNIGQLPPVGTTGVS